MDFITAVTAAIGLALSSPAPDSAPVKDAYKIEDGQVKNVNCSDMSKWFDVETKLACGRTDGDSGNGSKD